MNTSTADLLKRVFDLTEKDRAALAGLLIASLEEEPDEDLESVWKAETTRRLSELDSGNVAGISWEDVKMRLMKAKNG